MPLPHKSFQDAREQAAEFLGFAASEYITTPTGEVFEIPNPSLLDDEQQTRFDCLQIEMESWDHHPDVLGPDGAVIRRGEMKDPARKNGELVENYAIQLAKAIFGGRYPAFVAAGGRGNDVSLIWWKMQAQLAKRRADDSKSVGSVGSVAAPAAGDRSGAVAVSPPAYSGVAPGHDVEPGAAGTAGRHAG